MLWSLAVFGFVADQMSKYGVFRWLYRDSHTGQFDIIPGWFGLIAQFTGQPLESGNWRGTLQALNGPVMPHVNNGALFGLGNGFGMTANGFFAVISILAALAILVWSIRVKNANDPILFAALGLILGGTLGNFYDRVVFHGVRDFLDFYKIRFPVFNIADCCLVVGAGLLMLQAVWPGKAATGESINMTADKSPVLTP
jgi:lipoprotein signal peptidase